MEERKEREKVEMVGRRENGEERSAAEEEEGKLEEI